MIRIWFSKTIIFELILYSVAVFLSKSGTQQHCESVSNKNTDRVLYKSIHYVCVRFEIDWLHDKELSLLHEPAHDKTNKMACAPSQDSDQPGHQPSLISLRFPHEESLGP